MTSRVIIGRFNLRLLSLCPIPRWRQPTTKTKHTSFFFLILNRTLKKNLRHKIGVFVCSSLPQLQGSVGMGVVLVIIVWWRALRLCLWARELRYFTQPFWSWWTSPQHLYLKVNLDMNSVLYIYGEDQTELM